MKKRSSVVNISDYLLTPILVIALAFIFRATVAQSYFVPSGSMETTLLIGDRFFAEKISTRFGFIERGDIITFANSIESGGSDLVKRVVGLPDEEISIIGKTVYIDGAPLDEPYTRFTNPFHYNRIGSLKVPAEHYFVMGDNRDNSFDSRGWGFLKAESIKSKAMMIFWSRDDSNKGVRWDRIGKIIP